MGWSLNDNNVGVFRNLNADQNLITVVVGSGPGSEALTFDRRNDGHLMASLLKYPCRPNQPVMATPVYVGGENVNFHVVTGLPK